MELEARGMMVTIFGLLLVPGCLRGLVGSIAVGG
jgi:hypothetical protein